MLNSRPAAWWRYVIALGGVVAVTGLLLLLRHYLAPVNLILGYVPLVLVTAIRFGRRAAVLASGASFLAYNFWFVPPLYTLTVEQPQDVIELVVFLGVSLLVGTLAARERMLARAATRRAEQMAALYHLSKEIATTVDVDNMLPKITAAAREVLLADGVLVTYILPGSESSIICQAGRIHSEAAYTVPIGTSGQASGTLQVWGIPTPLDVETVALVHTVATHVALMVQRTQAFEAVLQARSLREADRLKGALLSSVSHDLRTPLAAIKGAASNLLDTSVAWDAPTEHFLLETISSEADRLNRFVRNLLEMSRIETTSMTRPYTCVEIGDVMAQTVQRLRPILQDRELVVTIPPDLPPVPMDAVQIELVLSNLLENAAKFAPQSPISIHVEQQDQALQVRVVDQGPGVPISERLHIWEKFNRGAAPEQGPGGSGLGLAIAKGIIEAHGGHIQVTDGPGGGAIFEFTLPLASTTISASAYEGVVG